MSGDRELYVSWFRLDERDYYAPWIPGTPDRYFVDEGGTIPVFAERRGVLALAEGLGAKIVEEEPSLQDLDRVQAWVRVPAPDTIACRDLNAGWNLFLDVAHSLASGELFLAHDARLTDLYDKLFRGCNLPAVAGDGPLYPPRWSPQEVRSLAAVLQAGLHLVRSAIRFRSQRPAVEIE